tara:strand:- start:248 stop:907 length:660 start_codon:yes stop_codon:yes gene_type:complete
LNDKVKIKSEINYGSFSIILIGGIVVLCLGIFSSQKLTENNIGIYSGIILSIIGTYFIYRALIFDVLEITGKKLIVKSIFGKTKKELNLDEFISYNEIEKHYNTKHSNVVNWDLTLFTKTSKYKISSTNYKNYTKLKKHLTKKLSRNIRSEKKWNRNNGLRIGIATTVCGLIFGILVYVNGFNDYELLDYFIVFGFLIIFVAIGIYLIIKNKKPVANTV